MNHTLYKVIGLMSGTSLDGLDIAYCHFEKPADQWNFQLVKSKFVPYSDQKRVELIHLVKSSAEALLEAHHAYGKWLGEEVKQFVNENDLQVDLVASHGHTIFHQPDKGFTFQLGEGQSLATSSGIHVISDFRMKDVVAGGQGAPLVPIGDQLLFGSYDFCLNLGGISNISFTRAQQRIAADISPANMLLNHLCKKIGMTYDAEGEVARGGEVSQELLDQLNALTYYTLPFPKSLGYEWFVEEVMPIVDSSQVSIPDQLCTAVHHIATQIKWAIHREMPEAKGKEMMIAGGGAKNDYLVEIMRSVLKDHVEVMVPEDSIIFFKEAIVFGLMGVLRLRNEINCLASVTGAAQNVSGGIRYYPS